MDLTIAIFILVYVAMGMGHLPGLLLDRSGSAIVGAMLLLVTGCITPAAAWEAIDYRSVGLLFGLMVVSAAFSVAGFYDRVAQKVGRLIVGPKTLLAYMITVAAAMAALLNKDVVAVAMAPVICAGCLERKLNPVPYLLAFCFAANFGSCLTLIGSPQSMIVSETLDLSFIGFTRAAGLPALLALPVVWVMLVWVYRGKWTLAAMPVTAASGMPPPALTSFNRGETIKAGLVILAVIAAFIFTDEQHLTIALAGASVLLISRRFASRNMLHRVNGDLLLLLIGLFIVNAAMTSTGLPRQLLADLRGFGVDLQDPLSILVVMSVLSNIIGNNPAVMLVTPFIDGSAQPEVLGAAIALGTGLSSSAVISGSLVGIIVAEQCALSRIPFSFGNFARVGLPTSVIALTIASAWIYLISS